MADSLDPGSPSSRHSDNDAEGSLFYDMTAPDNGDEWDHDPDYTDNPEEIDEDEDAPYDDDEDQTFHDAHEDEEEDEDYQDEPNEDDDEDEQVQFRVIIGDEGAQDIAVMRLIAPFGARSRTGMFSRQQLLALFGTRDLSSQFMRTKDPNRFPKVPSEEGIKLMRSGVFGANEYSRRTRKHIARRLLERELGIGNREHRRTNSDLLTQSLIPSTRADHIIHYDNPIYSGQFSDDGNFFFSVCQDFKVRMYDTSNPYNWKYYKTVSYPWGQWTLTDATLSPDNRWLAYTSIQSIVSIAPTDPNDTGDPYSLDLDDGETPARRSFWRNRGSFGIWSVRFSGDGRELVAGTSASSIVVYDIESRRVLHHVQGHSDDVNAVCFADKASPHILYSGSDDTTIKVWDRRSMGDGREAGAFLGHIEGLTYIDSKGDGRYILSNGKDQSMKLWDLRMVMSTDRFQEISRTTPSRLDRFDYRGEDYDEDEWDAHPHDNSLVTFRGHKVLRTLIRCHFSPPASTNSRYVYSGSSDGKVYIWNLDATKAGVIDVKAATAGTRKKDRRTRMYFDDPGSWGTCVRDASWHPSAPVLVASAWNGYSMARGTCSLHSFNESRDDEGDPSMGRSVGELLQPDPENYFPSKYGSS